MTAVCRRAARRCLAATTAKSAWVEYRWYAPGHDTIATKQASVRTVRSRPEVFVFGSGRYVE